jgi:uncharacterized repeat protein (TIGR01451 family)
MPAKDPVSISHCRWNMKKFRVPCCLPLSCVLWLLASMAAWAQAPGLLTAPTNQFVTSGSTVTFAASGSGATPLHFQWQFFGTNLSGATNASLVLSNVPFSAGGVYAVRVSNAFGAVTSAPVLLSIDEHLAFRLLELQTNGAVAIEHAAATGDDRGGLAVSPTTIFVTGDQSTARASAANFSALTSLGQIYDGLCNNLRTETVYLLANGTNAVTSGGGVVNGLLEVDGETGLLTGNRIAFSTNISIFSGAVFSGYDRIVLVSGSSVFDVLLPSGQVTFRGTLSFLPRRFSESWLSWGIAEYFDNALHLVYARNDGRTIARSRVGAPSSSSAPTTLQTFENIGDMASIAFSISRSRWYFHYEGFAQFRSGDETLGSAKAIYSTNRHLPVIYQHPQPQTLFPGDTATLRVTAIGAGPFTYQWRSNGVLIEGAVESSFVLSNVEPVDSANYSVAVGNASGAVVSSNAFVFVIGRPEILVNPVTQSAPAGTNLTFSALVRAAPPVHYQWRFNGTNVPGGTNVSLHLPVVTAAHAGEYSLFVSNRYGTATSQVARLTLIAEAAFSFRILSLSNNGVTTEHGALTGPAAMSLVVSSNRVFVSGVNQAAGFAADSLNDGSILPTRHQALLSDLRTEKIYSLGIGTNLFTPGSASAVSTLIEIDGNTGQRTGTIVPLSQSVFIGFGAGLFSGYGQVVLHTGNRVFSVALPSGVVADLGQMFQPPHNSQDNWAFWGLAENFGGSVYLVTPSGNSVMRTRVPDGLATTIANFVFLGDMPHLAASVARGRWYFQHDGPSEFGGTNQAIGYASATFSVTPNPVVDHFEWEPLPGAQFTGVPFPVEITARTVAGSIVSNFSGQVSFAGVSLSDGTPISVTPSDSGPFSNGVWRGSLTVVQPSAGMAIRAVDFAGRFGVSEPFSVVATNDLALLLQPSTNVATRYAAMSFRLVVTNSGPETSTGVWLTNQLPAGVDLISVEASQGSCMVNDGRVICDIGTMGSGSSALIEIAVVPQGLETLTNSAVVVRSAAEDHYGNNVANIDVPVQMPAIVVANASAIEGNAVADRGIAVFAVTLNTTSPVPVWVRFTTAPGSATNAGDYATQSGLLHFAPGIISTNVRVLLGPERNYEPDEQFFLNFFNATNAMLVRTQAVGTIVNDDPLPSLMVTNFAVVEGNSGSPLVSFAVRLSSPASVPVSVNYAASNGTAIVGSDFSGGTGLLVFTNGATNLFASFNVIGDTVGESNEFFYIRFFNSTNVSGNTQIVVNIPNDDAVTVDHFDFAAIGATQALNTPFPVTIFARDYSDNLVTSFNGTVGLSALTSAGDSVVNLGFGQTTWNFPLDTFWHDARTQVIYPVNELAGVRSIKSLALNVLRIPGQSMSNWTIRMKHTTKSEYSGSDGFEPGGWTIVYQAHQTLTATGWTTFTFTTPFEFNGRDNLMIDFSFNNTFFTSSGDVAATAGSATRSVFDSCDSCLGDPLLWSGTAPSASFTQTRPDIRLGSGGGLVRLSPTNTTVFINGVWSGNVTVLEPSEGAQLRALDAAQRRGVSNPFRVELANDLGVSVVPSGNPASLSEPLVFTMLVSNAGPTTSTGVLLTNRLPAGATYLSAESGIGTVNHANGVLVANIGTLTNGQSTFLRVAIQATNAGLITNFVYVRRDQAEVFTNNNFASTTVDVVPQTVTVENAFVAEGHGGTTNLTFNVHLSAFSTQAVSVVYATASGLAVDGFDFVGVTNVLVLPPGVREGTITVPVLGDRLNEDHETLELRLLAATNATFDTNAVLGLIVNDDPLPMIAISDATVTEGRVNLTPVQLTLTLSEPSGIEVSAGLITLVGSAQEDDFISTNAAVVFPAGQTNATVTVYVRGDLSIEPDEQFFALLVNSFGATLAVAESRITIVNDDRGGGALDFFEWSSFGSAQTLQRPVNVALVARDGAGAVFPFNGSVSITALSGTNVVATSLTNATFTNGVWAGAIEFLATATNVVLLARNGAGQEGTTEPFNVHVVNLGLGAAAPPQALIDSPINYNLRVTNLGPHTATSVVLSNALPQSLTVVAAEAAAGSCEIIGHLVRCDAGSLTNGETTVITITVAPIRGGVLSNLFQVAAFEFDTALSNNVVGLELLVTGDDDADGLPDFWESNNGLSSTDPLDALGDIDGDGHNALQEFIAGTDPSSAASALRLVVNLGEDGTELRFATVPDKRYLVESAPSPAGPWTEFTQLTGDGAEAALVDFSPATQRFYRISVRR